MPARLRACSLAKRWLCCSDVSVFVLENVTDASLPLAAGHDLSPSHNGRLAHLAPRRRRESAESPVGGLLKTPYRIMIRLCRFRMTSQNPSLQSIATTARHPFGKAPITDSTIRVPYPLTADVIS